MSSNSTAATEELLILDSDSTALELLAATPTHTDTFHLQIYH
jgi:hypothetical protein